MANGRRTADKQGYDLRRQEDHDLLIEIKTKIDNLTEKVGDLSRTKGDQVDITDHEARIRALESLTWRGLGAVALMQVVITIGLVILQLWLKK